MESSTRYTRIVEDLRAEIEAGRLRPGDRLPSTREITRRWGVAMATATKALTALGQAGLVRPVAGVGTVVAGADRSGRSTGVAEAAAAPAAVGRRVVARSGATSAAVIRVRRSGVEPAALSAAAIVAAATAIADAEGLAALSMRRVATELGVATMSLYRHVVDKDDLLLQMMDAAFLESTPPVDPPPGWRARLELAATAMWQLFRRHPWLAAALSLTRPQPIRHGMAHTEWVLAELAGYGLSPAEMLTVHLAVFNYVRGTALNLEFDAEAEAASGLTAEEWLDSQGGRLASIVAGGEYPLLSGVMSSTYGFSLDDLFEFGLERLLDGLGRVFRADLPSSDV